jgi:hypothetical protein
MVTRNIAKLAIQNKKRNENKRLKRAAEKPAKQQQKLEEKEKEKERKRAAAERQRTFRKKKEEEIAAMKARLEGAEKQLEIMEDENQDAVAPLNGAARLSASRTFQSPSGKGTIKTPFQNRKLGMMFPSSSTPSKTPKEKWSEKYEKKYDTMTP